jgi:hypothetical protein
MKIHPKKVRRTLPDEGTYAAVLESVTGVPTSERPKRVQFGFRVAGYDELVVKDYAPSVEEGSLLRRDCDTLRGSPHTNAEIQGGLDPTEFIGRKVQLVVMAKPTGGGKVKSVAGPFTLLCESAE